jgi:hypothetical protein
MTPSMTVRNRKLSGVKVRQTRPACKTACASTSWCRISGVKSCQERTPTNRKVAGVLCLLMSVTSTFSLGTIPSWSVGATDASAVVRKILDAPLQYRLSAVSDLASQVTP